LKSLGTVERKYKMQKILIIQDKRIEYTIKKNNRAKRLSLSVGGNGQVNVTVPRLITIKMAETFVQQKAYWIIKTIEKIKQNTIPLEERNKNINYNLYKLKAEGLIKKRIRYYNQFYGYVYNRISIKQHKSRWGSCSSQRNLNFNYRIIFLPPELADYIVVHELCHLKEMNHSPRFWRLVAQIIPNYKEHEKVLKRITFQ